MSQIQNCFISLKKKIIHSEISKKPVLFRAGFSYTMECMSINILASKKETIIHFCITVSSYLISM